MVNRDESFWSILVFYEEDCTRTEKAAVEPSSAEPKKTENSAADPLTLSPEQEDTFNILKKWRNERAARDGVPPYLIANNLSLVEIAATHVKTAEDLLAVKGFGERRAEKYGGEILEILRAERGEAE